jgi:gliding motility-associated-like protein
MAQDNCNKMPFYPADYIGNPSLEQVSYSCETDLITTTSPLFVPMISIIPYWQEPVLDYMGLTYFGQCNRFYIPKNPRDYSYENSGYPLYDPLVPQPIPDGKGVIGISSDRSLSGSASSDRYRAKNYICTNLLRLLKKDSLYRLSFYLGFGIKDTNSIPYNGRLGYNVSKSPTKFALFGVIDSTHLPFPRPQGNHGTYGCLSQINPEWINLGEVIISGKPGSWVRAIIEFIAPADIESIGIGPACDMSDVPYMPRAANEVSEFYFLDHLQLYQASAPKPILEVANGSLCDGPNAFTTLHMKSDSYYAGSQLQWYKNNAPVNETGGSITITKDQYGEGWYQCGVQNDSVCIRSDSFYVNWDPVINPTISSDPDTVACYGETQLLAMNGGPNTTYLWSNGSRGSSITVSQSGTYTVEASNACNSVTATKVVAFKECPPILFVPSAFTPNHDGLNDIFKVHSMGTIKSFRISIFNRYGQRVFFTKEISQGWDAIFNHTAQPAGIYIWIAQYTDARGVTHRKNGTVAVIK